MGSINFLKLPAYEDFSEPVALHRGNHCPMVFIWEQIKILNKLFSLTN